MNQIASPRPVRPTLRLAKFVSHSRSLNQDETQVGGLLDLCDGIPSSPSSEGFPRKPPHLDLGDLTTPPYSPSSFTTCYCSSRPSTPSLRTTHNLSYICEICNPYPSSPVPLSPLSPTWSTWTTSSASTSNPPLFPAEIDDPSILFEFFSIVDRAHSTPSSSTCPSRSGSPLNQPSIVATPVSSAPLLSSTTGVVSTVSLSSKKRERDGKLKWRNWIPTKASNRALNLDLDKSSLPPSRTLTRNPFSRLLD